MNTYKILIKLIFLSLLVISGSSYAQKQKVTDELPSKQASKVMKGVVDQQYRDDFRIIISDMNLYYTKETDFYKRSGEPVTSIRRDLAKGTFVKYRVKKKGSKLTLIDLKIISKREFGKGR